MNKPFRFARILETAEHQVLVKACDHSSQLASHLAMLVPPGPTAILTVDTYTISGTDVRGLQLPLFMHTSELLLKALEVFSMQHANAAVEILLGSFHQVLTPPEINVRIQLLGESIKKATEGGANV